MLFLHLSSVFAGALVLGTAASSAIHIQGTARGKRNVPASHVLHERGMPLWENTWDKVGRASADLVLPMRIGLKQVNIDEGSKMLLDM